MSDTFQYIHMAYTGVVSVAVAYLGYRATQKKDTGHGQCGEKMRALELKVVVLEERINNESYLLDKIDRKLDDVRNSL